MVLDKVDLDLVPGEVVAVTGLNGSGKSTLLRLLVGVVRPTSGEVTGRPREVGYVPEYFPDDDALSALSYLVHMGRVRGLTTKDAVDRAGRLLDRLGLSGGRRTPLRRLSNGNLQKVAIAQAVMVRPRLFVLDEAWAGLDATAHAVLAELVEEIAGADGTVVYTDHRQTVGATRVLEVAGGGLIELAAEPVLVTRLVLAPPADTDLDKPLALPRNLSGAMSMAHDGEKVFVQVKRSEADELLMSVLKDGWSVLRVDEPVAVLTGGAAAPFVPEPAAEADAAGGAA
jgi:ABC-type transport system involved in cytochrome c biogenesis ATPase subunit